MLPTRLIHTPGNALLPELADPVPPPDIKPREPVTVYPPVALPRRKSDYFWFDPSTRKA